MARPKKPTGPKPVDSLRHQDKRANIPTNELRGFVEGDESAPSSMLYPRDPSLDPQLVWKGKDEKDRQPLEVPVVPIYIQEKILPQAIIENLRETARKGEPEPEMTLFNDYDGIEFQELVEFYRHEQNWANRMILGDSLLVMTSLAEKEGLKGKVQMIYMDPPYGIKFGSNWQVSTRKRDVKDGKAEDATRQPEQIKAFRDTWELGIHSYLAYLRDRLVVSRGLVSETGSIFVQIGDENVHLVRAVMDEVFGSDNFVSQITVQKTGGLVTKFVVGTLDYVLWYARDKQAAKARPLFSERMAGETTLERYDLVELSDGTVRRLTREEARTGVLPREAKRMRFTALESANPVFEFEYQGHVFAQRWKTNPQGLEKLANADRLAVMGKRLQYKRYLTDFPVVPLTDRWDSMQIGTELQYVVQTSVEAVQRCLLLATDPGDLVLDPTCGSGTTAFAAEQWGRRWITVDTSRVALALARTRLMGAKYPYYLLADSPEGQRKEAEVTRSVPSSKATHGDIRHGFVYERVPHVTLKSIANNAEIDVIWDKWQAKLEPLRESLNAALKQSWQEWKIPREADAKWSDAAKKLHADWWQARIARQQEIDKSIAAKAEFEYLYDKPYENKKCVRVAGPFTVESLSPHRMLGVDEDDELIDHGS